MISKCLTVALIGEWMFSNSCCRVVFTVFLYVLGLNSLFCFYFSWRIVDLEGADFAMYIGLSLFAVFSISGLVMIGFQVLQWNL